MSMLETIGVCSFYMLAMIVIFTVVAGIMALLEKIGFNNWLRGWLWYFGIIDNCPNNNKGE